MLLQLMTLAAGLTFAGPQPAAAVKSPEESLRAQLASVREKRVWEVRKTMLGAGEELRDAVAKESGPAKRMLADRLPGMAKDPFDGCRDLKSCKDAPLSFHVEDNTLIDDAFVALARPWLNLQKARGKDVKVSVDPGVGVRLELQDLPKLSSVTLAASPAPTGGFDVAVDDPARAAPVFASERDALLNSAR